MLRACCHKKNPKASCFRVLCLYAYNCLSAFAVRIGPAPIFCQHFARLSAGLIDGMLDLVKQLAVFHTAAFKFGQTAPEAQRQLQPLAEVHRLSVVGKHTLH